MSGLKIQLGSQGCSGGPAETPRAGHGMAGAEQDFLERLRGAMGPWETADVTKAPGELGWRVWESLQPGKLRHGGSTGSGEGAVKLSSSWGGLYVPQEIGTGAWRALQWEGNSSGVTEEQELRVLVGRRALSY